MTGRRRSRMRFVFRRSSKALKVILTLTIVMAAAALLTMGAIRSTAESDAEALRQQAADLENQNRQLVQKINDLGTPQSVRQIAREELDLVEPGTVVFKP